MLHATVTTPDLDAFCQLDRLGVSAIGQSVQAHSSALECRVLDPDDWCRRCGQQGVPRGTVVRRLAHVPLGWRPTTLRLRVCLYRCPDCRTVWRQDTTAAAAPRSKLSRHTVVLALKTVVIDHLSVTGWPQAWVWRGTLLTTRPSLPAESY